MRSWARRRTAFVRISAACACSTLTILAGCGGGQVTASSQPASGSSGAGTSSPVATQPAWPGANGNLSTSVVVLRGALKAAFASGRDGEPLRMPPPAVVAALKRYFATADPAEFNGANRVAFVWAFTDVHASTATRQIVDACFFADGENMVAAGSIAPGFSIHLMRLTRSSPGASWRVDGLYSP